MTDAAPTLAFVLEEPQDRVFILMETFNAHVRDHPAIQADDFLNLQATHISGVLAGFYQAIGARV